MAGRRKILSGYKKLAYGGVADAVRLLYLPDEAVPEKLDKMNLFNVSEIKKAKGGGMEIKFFDRLKALDTLRMLEDAAADGAAPFYAALERGAARAGCFDGDDE